MGPRDGRNFMGKRKTLGIVGSQTTFPRSSLYRLHYLGCVFYEIMREKRQENKTEEMSKLII